MLYLALGIAANGHLWKLNEIAPALSCLAMTCDEHKL